MDCQSPNGERREDGRGPTPGNFVEGVVTISLGTLFFHFFFKGYSLLDPAKFLSLGLGLYFVVRILLRKRGNEDLSLLVDITCLFPILALVSAFLSRAHFLHAGVMAASVWFFLFYKDVMDRSTGGERNWGQRGGDLEP